MQKVQIVQVDTMWVMLVDIEQEHWEERDGSGGIPRPATALRYSAAAGSAGPYKGFTFHKLTNPQPNLYFFGLICKIGHNV